VDIQAFRTSFPQLVGGGTVDQVYIRADSMATWGRVYQVIAAVTASGIDFSMVGEFWHHDE
jgi:biopolymer transport protein ExbD